MGVCRQFLATLWRKLRLQTMGGWRQPDSRRAMLKHGVPAKINLFKHGKFSSFSHMKIVLKQRIWGHTLMPNCPEQWQKNACWLVIIRKLCCYVLQYTGTWSAAIIVMGIPLRQPPTNQCSPETVLQRKKPWSKQQQPSSEIPPKISNKISINQSVISEIPWPPPKKIQDLFLFSVLAASCHIFGVQRIPWTAMSMTRGAQGQQFPLSDLLGGQPGRLIDVKPGEMLSGAMWTSADGNDGKLWWLKSGDWNMVNIG